MAIRHIIAHPELILHIAPEIGKEEEEEHGTTG
jgi:hypothetical protein